MDALPGTLDKSYGVAGRMALASKSGDFAIDRAGNVFVGGSGVMKFDATGHPATDFVDAGPAIVSFVTLDATGNVYTIQQPTATQYNVVKRDATGRLVQSFGQAGIADASAMRAISGTDGLLADGAGNVYVRADLPASPTGPLFIYLKKLDASGRPVSSFGSRGDGSLDLPSAASFFFDPTPIVDAAGNVFSTAPAPAGNIAVSGFDVNGQPAGGFHSGIIPVPACPQTVFTSTSIVQDAVGNIYVSASCPSGTDSRVHVFVVKLDAAGNPAGAFGLGGIATDFFVAGPDPARIDALQPAADGGLYVAAFVQDSECGSIAIAKLGADGKLVDAFGTHGVTRLDMWPGLEMAVDTSGRLYVAGRDKPAICPRLLGTTPISYSVYRLNG